MKTLKVGSTVDAFILWRDSMGGSGWENVAFLDAEVAQLEAEEKREEWTDYKPRKARVRVLNQDEGAHCGRIVRLNRESAEDRHRANAKAKLTPAERKALRL